MGSVILNKWFMDLNEVTRNTAYPVQAIRIKLYPQVEVSSVFLALFHQEKREVRIRSRAWRKRVAGEDLVWYIPSRVCSLEDNMLDVVFSDVGETSYFVCFSTKEDFDPETEHLGGSKTVIECIKAKITDLLDTQSTWEHDAFQLVFERMLLPQFVYIFQPVVSGGHGMADSGCSLIIRN